MMQKGVFFPSLEYRNVLIIDVVFMESDLSSWLSFFTMPIYLVKNEKSVRNIAC